MTNSASNPEPNSTVSTKPYSEWNKEDLAELAKRRDNADWIDKKIDEKVNRILSFLGPITLGTLLTAAVGILYYVFEVLPDRAIAKAQSEIDNRMAFILGDLQKKAEQTRTNAAEVSVLAISSRDDAQRSNQKMTEIKNLQAEIEKSMSVSQENISSLQSSISQIALRTKETSDLLSKLERNDVANAIRALSSDDSLRQFIMRGISKNYVLIATADCPAGWAQLPGSESAVLAGAVNNASLGQRQEWRVALSEKNVPKMPIEFLKVPAREVALSIANFKLAGSPNAPTEGNPSIVATCNGNVGCNSAAARSIAGRAIVPEAKVEGTIGYNNPTPVDLKLGLLAVRFCVPNE